MASFGPKIADFGRLYERFRLPAGIWEKIGGYSEYGFAVFQLKKGRSKVHPMAFNFPSAHGLRVFFPTVHVHDGKAHSEADFDHVLYAQAGKLGRDAMHLWRESKWPASRFVNLEKAHGLVQGDQHVCRREMIGKLRNEDVLLAAA